MALRLFLSNRPSEAKIADECNRHMAEETKNASVIVPRCMMWSYILNGGMGFVMLITYCFCLTNVDAALNPDINRSGYPYVSHLTGITSRHER